LPAKEIRPHGEIPLIGPYIFTLEPGKVSPVADVPEIEDAGLDPGVHIVCAYVDRGIIGIPLQTADSHTWKSDDPGLCGKKRRKCLEYSLSY
jgi:hypothetical protein